jgi:hypothetical protein
MKSSFYSFKKNDLAIAKVVDLPSEVIDYFKKNSTQQR